MAKIRIYAYGTRYFMDTYSHGLSDDCDRLGYDLHMEVVPDAENFSHINHFIHQRMVEVVRDAGADDRILFLDPECRIVRPIPQEWIDDPRPMVCYKIEEDKHDINLYQYGHTLPGAIQMQPIFLTHRDSGWIQWWYDVSMAGSDPDRNVYVPHELFLELSIKYNKVDVHTEHCVYNRDWSHPQRVVKGSYTTQDTIITHPDIHALLDENVKQANESFKTSPFLSKRKLHNHFNDLATVKAVDELMWKEIDDISKWPPDTVLADGWMCIDNWMFDPNSGRCRHKDYRTIKYHISVEEKHRRGIHTPAIKRFRADNPTYQISLPHGN